MARQNEYFPQSVPYPGVILSEKLEEMDMTAKEFALCTGNTEAIICAILNGKSPITPEIAMQFENVTLIPAHYWMSHQKGYDEYLKKEFHTHPSTSSNCNTIYCCF